MSRPTKSNPVPVAPAFDEPVLDLGPSPLDLFWEAHKSKVLIGAGAVIVAVIGFFAAMAITHQNRQAAVVAFAAATTVDGYREVIAKFPRSVEAGNSSLLLAAALRDEGKPDEARAALDTFLKTQPTHPLAPLALVSLANLAANAGDAKQAIADFEAVATQFPGSFAVPFSRLAAAEVALASGDRKAALAAFQALSRQNPNSTSAQVGQNILMALEALNLPAAQPEGAAPSPTPAP